jgi:hypothetical protein
MNIYQFISLNKLKPADAVELACRQAGFPMHYAIYLGIRHGQPTFIANITEGIRVIQGKQLLDFVAKYEVTDIERFTGTMGERTAILKRAISRLGEKGYNLVFNNCEHFKNWVLHNESKSKQVIRIGSTIAISGVFLYIIGAATQKRGLQKAGLILLLIPVIIIIIAYFIAEQKNKQV